MRVKNKKYDEVAKLYPLFSDTKIAEMTGLSIQTVRGIGVHAGLKKKKYYWTEKEDKEILANYEQYGWQHCAEKLERSMDAVKARYRKLTGKRK